MLPWCRLKLTESLVTKAVPVGPVGVSVFEPLFRANVGRSTTFRPGVPVMVRLVLILAVCRELCLHRGGRSETREECGSGVCVHYGLREKAVIHHDGPV